MSAPVVPAMSAPVVPAMSAPVVPAIRETMVMPTIDTAIPEPPPVTKFDVGKKAEKPRDKKRVYTRLLELAKLSGITIDPKAMNAKIVGNVPTAINGKKIKPIYFNKSELTELSAYESKKRSDKGNPLTNSNAMSATQQVDVALAKGGTFVASKPTKMLVGEEGKEKVTVQPLDSGKDAVGTAGESLQTFVKRLDKAVTLQEKKALLRERALGKMQSMKSAGIKMATTESAIVDTAAQAGKEVEIQRNRNEKITDGIKNNLYKDGVVKSGKNLQATAIKAKATTKDNTAIAGVALTGAMNDINKTTDAFFADMNNTMTTIKQQTENLNSKVKDVTKQTKKQTEMDAGYKAFTAKAAKDTLATNRTIEKAIPDVRETATKTAEVEIPDIHETATKTAEVAIQKNKTLTEKDIMEMSGAGAAVMPKAMKYRGRNRRTTAATAASNQKWDTTGSGWVGQDKNTKAVGDTRNTTGSGWVGQDKNTKAASGTRTTSTAINQQRGIIKGTHITATPNQQWDTTGAGWVDQNRTAGNTQSTGGTEDYAVKEPDYFRKRRQKEMAGMNSGQYAGTVGSGLKLDTRNWKVPEGAGSFADTGSMKWQTSESAAKKSGDKIAKVGGVAPMAKGGSFVTNNPTALIVGEKGPERVTVTPGKGGSIPALEGKVASMAAGAANRAMTASTAMTIPLGKRSMTDENGKPQPTVQAAPLTDVYERMSQERVSADAGVQPFKSDELVSIEGSSEKQVDYLASIFKVMEDIKQLLTPRGGNLAGQSPSPKHGSTATTTSSFGSNDYGKWQFGRQSGNAGNQVINDGAS